MHLLIDVGGCPLVPRVSRPSTRHPNAPLKGVNIFSSIASEASYQVGKWKCYANKLDLIEYFLGKIKFGHFDNICSLSSSRKMEILNFSKLKEVKEHLDTICS